MATNAHPSADWVYEKVRAQIQNISLGTVYRNLRQLVENGLIRAKTVDNVVHYDGNTADHQHFYCTSCKRLYDIDLSLEEFVISAAENLDHDIQGCDLQFNGVCDSCQKNR